MSGQVGPETAELSHDPLCRDFLIETNRQGDIGLFQDDDLLRVLAPDNINPHTILLTPLVFLGQREG